ncbi:MAG: IS1595 family transposase [Fimbriimonadaceae bacterium]|nr:IS1595 family transposase [Fimbriimonadaceae bacterium]
MKQKYGIREFEKQFPDDDACLEWLKDFLYPAGITCPICERVTKHHKVKNRKSYSCQNCGHHVHPTAGTIYHKSSTPLRLWFRAVFLMSTTRCGISAKQLERDLGVTYKTAWRMFKQIRSMLMDEPTKLSNEVEVDETYVGGKTKGKPGRSSKKVPVVGAVQRGGRVTAKAIDKVTKAELIDIITTNVEPGTVVYTDEYPAYKALPTHGYDHYSIPHWRKIYVDGAVHTNTIEGFWSLFKGGLKGVYKHCGREYLQTYVNEYAFRYNRRGSEVPMFHHFMAQTSQLSWWTPYQERVPQQG